MLYSCAPSLPPSLRNEPYCDCSALEVSGSRSLALPDWVLDVFSSCLSFNWSTFYTSGPQGFKYIFNQIYNYSAQTHTHLAEVTLTSIIRKEKTESRHTHTHRRFTFINPSNFSSRLVFSSSVPPLGRGSTRRFLDTPLKSPHLHLPSWQRGDSRSGPAPCPLNQSR